MRMRVLVLTAMFPNSQNLVHGKHIWAIVKNLSKFCSIKVIAPVTYFKESKNNKYKILQKEVKEGIEIHHPRWFNMPKLSIPINGLLMFIFILKKVWQIKKHFDFDIIDSYWLYPDGFTAVVIGKLFNRRVIVSARGSEINLQIKKWYLRRQIMFALKYSYKITVVSHDLKNKIIQLGIKPSKITVILNGVDLKQFNIDSKKIARKHLNLKEDKKILLSIGRMDADKGFIYIIEAVNKLKREGMKNILLLIIGEEKYIAGGKYLDFLSKKIDIMNLKEQVKLLGYIHPNKVHLYYQSADLFCLISEHEGCPNVIMESLACGTPVLSSKVGAIPEIITSEEYGYLVDNFGDTKEIFKKLRKALAKNWDSEFIHRSMAEKSWAKVALKKLSNYNLM